MFTNLSGTASMFVFMSMHVGTWIRTYVDRDLPE